MVVAWRPYADGNLQFFGNVQSVEIDGECTGRECQTAGGVTPTPPPPTGGGGKKWEKVLEPGLVTKTNSIPINLQYANPAASLASQGLKALAVSWGPTPPKL